MFYSNYTGNGSLVLTKKLCFILLTMSEKNYVYGILLCHFWFSLPLSLDNGIKEIKGIENCHRLQKLSLAHNKIDRIQGLDNLPIQYLNLVSFAEKHYSSFLHENICCEHSLESHCCGIQWSYAVIGWAITAFSQNNARSQDDMCTKKRNQISCTTTQSDQTSLCPLQANSKLCRSVG